MEKQAFGGHDAGLVERGVSSALRRGKVAHPWRQRGEIKRVAQLLPTRNTAQNSKLNALELLASSHWAVVVCSDDGLDSHRQEKVSELRFGGANVWKEHFSDTHKISLSLSLTNMDR